MLARDDVGGPQTTAPPPTEKTVEAPLVHCAWIWLTLAPSPRLLVGEWRDYPEGVPTSARSESRWSNSPRSARSPAVRRSPSFSVAVRASAADARTSSGALPLAT